MKLRTILLVGICALACTGADAASYEHVAFDSTQRYSRLVIDARLNDFYANKNQMGFQTFTENGEKISAPAGASKLKFDYVPGLVAKALIEAVDYYQTQSWARPWFYSVEWYGNTYLNSVPSTGGSLDNLNATKMYFGLSDLTSQGSVFDNETTYANAHWAMSTAVKGLSDHNDRYSISASTLEDAAGGWFHKSSYVNQMWLDGQYMGPALLAQLNNYGYAIAGIDNDALITNQFDICWRYLWNDEEKLLYHAMTASPGDRYSRDWQGVSASNGIYHSAEYWGRACGWYFLALVDVLEQFEKREFPILDDEGTLPFDSLKNILRTQLNELASGLAARQDAETGCWYQLLAHDGTFYADSYQGWPYNRTYNYLESSATCIFTAAYLKGMRLGLFNKDYSEVARKAYRGIIEQFLVKNTADEADVHLINCCRSAGLGGSSRRDGSAAYYLLGSDVSVTSIDNPQTEGKVFGSFILASTEYERLYMPISSEGGGIEEISADTDSCSSILNAQGIFDLQGRRITEKQRTFSIEGGRCVYHK